MNTASYINNKVLKAAFLVLCLSVMSFGFFACTSEEQEPSYVSPYTWENLVEDNGRYSYHENSTLQSRFGVDVSEHQGLIDWEAAANDGVEFAIIRIGNRGATEGLLYLDDYYEHNIKAAKQAGILVGVYFFSQALNEEEALEEAAFVLEHLEGQSLDYPVVFDHEPVTSTEGRANDLSPEQISLCAKAFCRAIETAGYETMLYGNKADLIKLDETLLSTTAVWFAEYDVVHPTIEHDFIIWQYTSSGSVAGINTHTDLNIHFLTLEQSSEEEST